MDRIKRIVFVCTGNTCRSPMAAALARKEVRERGLLVEIDSCGTGVCPGDRATDEAIRVCAEINIDLSHHSAKNITELSDDDDSLYIVMTRQHASWLRYVIDIPGDRIVLLGEGIPDPYGGSVEVYRKTRDRLIEAITNLFDRIEVDIPKGEEGMSLADDDSFEYAIHKAEGENAPAISLIEARNFSDAWSLALLADEIENEDAIALIASDVKAALTEAERKAQKVYGYAIAIVAADEAQLLKLSVDEGMRRRGIAQALLAAVAEKARERGCTTLTLEVRVSNATAIALYEKNGFESLGVRPNFYSFPKEDAEIMTKDLTVCDRDIIKTDIMTDNNDDDNINNAAEHTAGDALRADGSEVGAAPDDIADDDISDIDIISGDAADIAAQTDTAESGIISEDADDTDMTSSTAEDISERGRASDNSDNIDAADAEEEYDDGSDMIIIFDD